MLVFADTHTHLYAEQFDEDRHEMVLRAIEKGVKHLFIPNIDVSTLEAMHALETAFPENCHAMLGLHPCSVKDNFEEELSKLEASLRRRPYLAVGEMGLDLYWDKTHFEEQKEAFRRQVKWAEEFDLPIILHTREANREALDLISELYYPNMRGIFHCFSGTPEEANEMVEAGFLLGIGGVSTFKNGGLDKVLPQIGLEHLVLETDSPYLAPTPYRGKRNESSYIPIIAERVAAITENSLTEVAEVTTKNALSLFGI